MRRHPLLLVSLAGLITAGALACGRGKSQSPPPDAHAEAPEAAEPGSISIGPEARANIGLMTVAAEERVIERTLVLNATLKVDPDHEAFVSSRVQGKVTSVAANVGDQVRRAQPLVVLQSLQIAETPPSVEITSPLEGIVMERSVTVGETVDQTKELFHVADLSHLLAEAEVYEADLGSVRRGQQARLRVTPYPDLVFTGRVVRLADAIDPVRRTLRVWIEVANTPDRKLKPDMFAQANLIVATSGRSVTVPNDAIQSDGPSRFVFVQNGEAFQRQEVVVGDADDRYTAIRSGVIVGDLVVTRGAAELKTVSTQRAGAGGLIDESKPHVH